MAYGIANRHGRASESDAAAVLDRAMAAGVTLLDTAPSYGDAEALLGRLNAAARFRIVTKTPDFRGRYRKGDATKSVRASLARLHTDRLDSVLIHQPDDLRAPYTAELLDELLELKSRGLLARIGISVYGRDDIDRFGRLDAIDVVQLPLNLLDQRALRDGTLDLLVAHGVEIHLRSVFLQGLLLMPPDSVPDYFDRVRPQLRRMHDDASLRGLSLLSVALGFVRHLSQPAIVLVGVDSPAHLDGILAAWSEAPALDAEVYSGAPADIVDPRKWPRFH